VRRLGPAVTVGIAVAAAVAFFLVPVLWQIVASIAPEEELARGFFPRRPTLAAYGRVFEGRPFLRAIGNSIAVAAATTAFSLAVGGAAAFAIAKLPFRGRGLLLGVALAVSMFPPIATVSPLYLMLRALGLRDRLSGLVLPNATFALPLAMWVLSSVFRQIPDELYRAARVDGCTPFGAFVRVFLPLAAPGFATTGLLVFIATWNELLFALTFLSSPRTWTVPVAISLFATEHKEPWAEIAAASLVAVLPLALLTLIFQRRIVAGLTAGAVKE
jgi:multiple sugar transport system permease protein